jgi:hypothetical protein
MAKKSEISGAFDIQKSMDALLLDEMKAYNGADLLKDRRCSNWGGGRFLNMEI